MTIEGYFGGSWHTSTDIQRATLVHPKKRGLSFGVKAVESWRNSFSELQSVMFNLLFDCLLLFIVVANLSFCLLSLFIVFMLGLQGLMVELVHVLY